MPSVKYQAILFDMDGTLVDSTACVEAIWSRWAERQGLEPSQILAASHGRRTLDTLRDVAPHLDLAQEAMLLDAEELESTEGIEAVQGAAALLRLLPQNRWAVVTSAGRALAELRLGCAGLPIPEVLVCADDVAEGKPNPAGYLRAARLLGVAPDQCLVVEDTPAGILAGRSAGMQVLALTTTYPAASLLEAHCIGDFCQTQVVPGPDGIELQIS
jgi:mannitol-1-/sugar-/sorbitol-6-phosphatase